jgi:hypothetical protein
MSATTRFGCSITDAPTDDRVTLAFQPISKASTIVRVTNALPGFLNTSASSRLKFNSIILKVLQVNESAHQVLPGSFRL